VKPRVVLTLSRQDTPERRAASGRYARALEAAGARVVAVLPGEIPPAEFDALCLSGGGDVQPRRYHEENVRSENIDADRDELEFHLVERALAADLPVLGICRGCQVLNVALGGSLEQHRTGHGADDHATHLVRAVRGSLLAEACGDGPLRVNSRHHQAVTDARLAPALRAVARVGDLIEAVESTTHRWVLGVQWHPERTGEVDARTRQVFSAFVRAASRS